MKLLQYMFIRFYQLSNQLRGGYSAFGAVMMMAFCLGFNVQTVFDVAYLFGYKVGVSVFGVFGFLIAMTVGLYFLLVYGGKSDALTDEYEAASKESRRKGMIVVLVYVFLSFGAFIGSLLLMGVKNGGGRLTW